MERIAHILASGLCDSEWEALKQVASGTMTLGKSQTETLRRLRLIDPSHGKLTPLGRDVLRVSRKTCKT